MVQLLGSRDELLHVIEREFNADIHVRGNEVTVSGPPAETALVSALFAELIELLGKGTELSPDAVERAAAMLRVEHGVRPAEVLTQGILSSRGRTFYQAELSRYTPHCPYTPSCSEYAARALDKHVTARGSWLTLRRLVRCRPGTRGGSDPVP